jgi:hypothetical protein
MNLHPEECDQFYRIWFSLLSYANKREGLVPSFPKTPLIGNIKQQDAGIIRNTIWSSDYLLSSFVSDNPDNLSMDDMRIAISWEGRINSRFMIIKHLKQHSIFMDVSDNGKVYGVKGIISPISEILPFPLPIMVDAVLLPFVDKVIIDSLLIPHNVIFGRGIVNDVKAQFRRLEESLGIIINLNDSDPSPAILKGNKKILSEFQKWLGRQSLSPKMQHEHFLNIEILVRDILNIAPVQSLSQLSAESVSRYLLLSNKTNKVSVKRLLKFLIDTDRLDFDESAEIEDVLKK